MANSDSTPVVPPPTAAPLSARKENVTPASSKIAELTESRQELLTRIQNLKTHLQSWRSKLDGQVKEDVTASLRNLGLQDVSEETKEAEDAKPNNDEEKTREELPKDSGKDTEQ
ncbi:PREDICTED: uncharacterized protein LOC109227838 [Nicotiana attenuata]|uniref:uncharacterized protein LOC109227838 n=1 Tax=Nicotiana attenuata TaxID=49451 RepID=UPI00090599E6|nr:PREDICTED: uncharacterized protein LOC109227838 [Nicotiana attenuata]